MTEKIDPGSKWRSWRQISCVFCANSKNSSTESAKTAESGHVESQHRTTQFFRCVRHSSVPYYSTSNVNWWFFHFSETCTEHFIKQ